MIFCNLSLKDYEHYKSHIQSNFTLELYTEFVNNLSNNHQVLLMKDNDNNIIGSATILIETKLTYGGCKMGHIENVLINDDKRGKGYGKILVDKLIEICKDNGCYRIDLVCSEDLIPFYIKINKHIKQQIGLSFMIEENFK